MSEAKATESTVTDLHGSNSYNVVGRGNQPIHAAIAINLDAGLLDELQILLALGDVAVYWQELPTLWRSSRHHSECGSGNDRGDVVPIRILRKVSIRTVFFNGKSAQD